MNLINLDLLLVKKVVLKDMQFLQVLDLVVYKLLRLQEHSGEEKKLVLMVTKQYQELLKK